MQGLHFQNTYVDLPESFYARAKADEVPNPTLIAFNNELAQEMGIDFSTKTETEIARVFSGNVTPEGASSIALAYSGHQFGHFAPVLGDGRALLLGEVISPKGERFDIQLKGSGATRFSRRGDGKSSLGPVIREYIASEAMHHLGVPTSRALAAVRTGENVFREQPLPGGVFTRVASSHMRVGTFEYFASRQDYDSLQKLLDYAVSRHYAHIQGSEELALDFFKEVAKRQAELIARWMCLGFIHGVMNTDNFSIAGITIDYGPCAYIDTFSDSKVFSSIDHHGRYAYQNQPAIAQWNLARLAETFLGQLSEKEKKPMIEAYQNELAEFDELYNQAWLKTMRAKLGIERSNNNYDKTDAGLARFWLEYLQKEKLDFTISFRNLTKVLDLSAPKDEFPKTEEFKNFTIQWKKRLTQENKPNEEIIALMNSHNPLYIARNHQIERAIQAAINEDYSVFHEMNQLLQNPFKEQAGMEKYTLAPLDHEVITKTFCGT